MVQGIYLMAMLLCDQKVVLHHTDIATAGTPGAFMRGGKPGRDFISPAGTLRERRQYWRLRFLLVLNVHFNCLQWSATNGGYKVRISP